MNNRMRMVVAAAWAWGAAGPVMAEPPEPPSRRQTEAMAGLLGADCKAIVEKLEGFGTRHTQSRTDSADRGIGAAREWIRSELERYARSASPARMTVAFEEFEAPASARLPGGAKIVNVVATIPGSMPEAADRRYYVVGHYDSRNSDPNDAEGDAPGANDNASGVAVAMGCARVLASATGPRLESTVVFLLTAGEEQGLIGAAYHASQAAARGERIAGVLNNDIVGDPSDPLQAGSRHWTVRVFSEGLPRQASAETLASLRSASAESDSASRQLARYVEWVAAQHEGKVPLVSMILRQDRFMRGGDHMAFNDAGYPAVRFTVAREHYDRQHVNVTRVNDTPYGDIGRYVSSDYLGAVARLNLATLMNLANAPRPPADARIVTAKLDNQTVLRWSASPEPDVIGYEVVYRLTTESQWGERIIDAGRNTEITLKISKDDHFFGIVAYDRDGYRSPAAFAMPARE